VDLFACGCLLFELVMKAQPFKSSDLKDEHYKKIAGNEKMKYWEIFSSSKSPSN
jgi:hypothetical protein